MGGNTELKTNKNQGLIHFACIHGFMPTLAYLKYEVGINTTDKDINLMNPLHLAAKSGNFYTVQSLIA